MANQSQDDLTPLANHAFDRLFDAAVLRLPKGMGNDLPAASKAKPADVRNVTRQIWKQFVETGDKDLAFLNRALTPYFVGEKPSENEQRLAWEHWSGVSAVPIFGTESSLPAPKDLVKSRLHAIRERLKSVREQEITLLILEALVGVQRMCERSEDTRMIQRREILAAYVTAHRKDLANLLQHSIINQKPGSSEWNRARVVDRALALEARFYPDAAFGDPLTAKEVRAKLKSIGIDRIDNALPGREIDLTACAAIFFQRLAKLYRRQLDFPGGSPTITDLYRKERYEEAEQLLREGTEAEHASQLACVLAAMGKSEEAVEIWQERVRAASPYPADYWNLALQLEDSSAFEALEIGLRNAPRYDILARYLELGVRLNRDEVERHLFELPVLEVALVAAVVYRHDKSKRAVSAMQQKGEPFVLNPGLKANLGSNQIDGMFAALLECGSGESFEFWLACRRTLFGKRSDVNLAAVMCYLFYGRALEAAEALKDLCLETHPQRHKGASDATKRITDLATEVQRELRLGGFENEIRSVQETVDECIGRLTAVDQPAEETQAE